MLAGRSEKTGIRVWASLLAAGGFQMLKVGEVENLADSQNAMDVSGWQFLSLQTFQATGRLTIATLNS